MRDDPIDESTMREALLRSGYLLEMRAAKVFESFGLFAMLSAPYPDPVTAKSREIDIIAGIDTQLEHGRLIGQLVVECKHVPQPIVFFTRKSHKLVDDLAVKIAGLPVPVKSGNEPEFHARTEIEFANFHHYFRKNLSSQFCSFIWKEKGNDKRWIASGEDQHFDAFQKLADAVRFFSTDWTTVAKRRAEGRIDLCVFWPIVVVQGSIFEADIDDSELRLSKIDHTVFLFQRTEGNYFAEYCIDVITEQRLPSFLNELRAELEQTRDRVLMKRELFEKMVDVSLGRYRPTEAEQLGFSAVPRPME